MKICWDNLEGMWLSNNGNLRKGTHTYIEKELCEVCGISFLTRSDNPTAKHCSHSCACKGKNNPMFGKIGKENPAFGRIGEKHPMFGKKRPEHSKLMSGKNNPNYNPNLTDENRLINRSYFEYNEWRQVIYKRDNYTCQKCGSNKSGSLNAHHIQPYRDNPTLRTEISNGITFCKKCHKKFHHLFGYGNNTRAQLINFLKM